MKHVLIAGASGMVGNSIFNHCLDSSEISQVISLVRNSTENAHPKLKEVVITDFGDLRQHKEWFHGIDIAFFCIGVYTGQVSDVRFKEITVDYAVSFARVLQAVSPDASLCLLSGAGADRTERSRMSFARYKGMAENQISSMNLGQFYSFRPAYIYPVQARKEPNLMYRVSRALYPLIRLMGKNSSIKSTELAQAMFNVGLKGAAEEILENKQILMYA